MDAIQEQITKLQKEIRETPYHKGTERHIGILRARISRLKEKQLGQTSGRGGGKGGYAVRKQGDATIVLVGPPSAGKSTLLNKLTNAESRVAPYSFTTVSVIPGMMQYRGANLQILDVPGLIEGAEEGRGRGQEVMSVVRGADLLILMRDIGRKKSIGRISTALERNGIRINKNPPQVRVIKKLSGGISVKSNLRQNVDMETIKDMAREMGVKNADITIDEVLDMERLLDAFSRNRVYVRAIEVISKADLGRSGSQDEKYLYISAESGEGIEELKTMIWEKLSFITVYLVKRNEEPGRQNPIIMKMGDRMEDVARKIGSDFFENHKRAKIWGGDAKFPGQEVSLSILAKDGVMVRFI